MFFQRNATGLAFTPSEVPMRAFISSLEPTRIPRSGVRAGLLKNVSTKLSEEFRGHHP